MSRKRDSKLLRFPANVLIVGGGFVVMDISINNKRYKIMEPSQDDDPQKILDIGSVMALARNAKENRTNNTLRMLHRALDVYVEKWGGIELARTMPQSVDAEAPVLPEKPD